MMRDQQQSLPVFAAGPFSSKLPPPLPVFAAAGPSSPTSVRDVTDSAPPSSNKLGGIQLTPLSSSPPDYYGANGVDEEDNSVKADPIGVSTQSISLDYIPFQDIDGTEQQQQQQQQRRKVDQRIFLPLYVVTACLVFLPMLPSFLMILLVTIWGILFLFLHVYFLYYYDPLNCMPCGSK